MKFVPLLQKISEMSVENETGMLSESMELKEEMDIEYDCQSEGSEVVVSFDWSKSEDTDKHEIHISHKPEEVILPNPLMFSSYNEKNKVRASQLKNSLKM